MPDRRPAALLLLLLPAIALAAACGGGEGEDSAAGLLHRAVVAARGSDAGIVERFDGELPPGLPADPPLYPEADLIVSSRIIGPAATQPDEEEPTPDAGGPRTVLYFIVLDTEDTRAAVYEYYEEALDEGPWQLESTSSVRDMDRLEFVKRDDADIIGAVQTVGSDDGSGTSIFISLQDAGGRLEEPPPATAEPGVSLPGGFPEDVPIPDGVTLTGTSFFRGAEQDQYLVIFLTEDAPEDALTFYRDAFQELEWTVRDRRPLGDEISLSFEDEASGVRGTLTAAPLADDDELTEVRITADVPNEGASTPTPEPTQGDDE